MSGTVDNSTKQDYLSAVAFARKLRKQATDCEQLCWYLLRNRQVLGVKFRRQYPFPPYTLDFYCPALKLAIELDGSQHVNNQRDKIRDKFLANNGIEVLRFYNNELLKNTKGVLASIYQCVEEKSHNTPSPCGRGQG